MEKQQMIHPYIPNSVPEVRNEMLERIGVKAIEELYEVIPQELRLGRSLNLPKPFLSEYALRRHVETLLAKNKSCKENLNFLGAGCWQHYVPAVCDEIASRAEFLTAYAGNAYTDLGKCQAFFEYQSMMGELLEMEVVSAPTYDWSSAISSSLLMASRITGRNEILIPAILCPDKLRQMRNFCKSALEFRIIEYDPVTGTLNLEDLRAKISSKTGAVYFENPSYLGVIEVQAEEVSEIAHAYGAISIVGVDPSSLGIMTPPGHYGADIVCGDAQPLGIHMNFGGGACAFIATRDEEKYVTEFPTFLYSIVPTSREGEYGFGRCTVNRTSNIRREKGQDFTGTTQSLWAIVAGVYLALLGPQGMRDLGTAILQKAQYARQLLSQIRGVRTPIFSSASFKEFVVNFDGTGRTVQEINKALLRNGIYGGKDISHDFPEFGNSALYCVTEIYTQEDLHKLAHSLEEVVL